MDEEEIPGITTIKKAPTRVLYNGKIITIKKYNKKNITKTEEKTKKEGNKLEVKNKEGTLVFYYDPNKLTSQDQIDAMLEYLQDITTTDTEWIILPNFIRVEALGEKTYKLFYSLKNIKKNKPIDYGTRTN